MGPLVVGLKAGLHHESGTFFPQAVGFQAPSAARYFLEPIVGVNIDLTADVSLLPKLLYEHDWYSGAPGQNAIGLSLPVVVHVPYFAMMFGPIVLAESGPSAWEVGLRTLIGTWF